MSVIFNPDVVVSNHGSVFLVQPVSDDAKAWVDAHIGDDAIWLGPAFGVDHRYIDDIVAGMSDDGLVVA